MRGGFFLIMKKILLFTFCILSAIASNAQDSTATKSKEASADGFGLSAGIVYGNLRMDKVSQFVPGSDKALTASPKSALGLSAALFYEFGKPELSFRIATEANFLQTYVEYDSGEQNKVEGYVYPVTIEVPIMGMYHFQKKFPFSIGIGPRVIFPISLFNSSHPETNQAGLNIDFALSKKIPLKNTAMRIELAYSLGLTNLLLSTPDDYYTNNIPSIKRDILAVRFYFN